MIASLFLLAFAPAPVAAQLPSPPGAKDGVRCLAISPDGSTLALGVIGYVGESGVYLWDINGGRFRSGLSGRGADATCLAYSPDGSRLFSGNKKGDLGVWDPDRGLLVGLINAHRGTISDITVTADGKRIVTAGWDKTVRVWDARTFELLHTFRGFLNGVECIALSSNGRLLAAGGFDCRVFVFDMTTRKLITHLEHESSVRSFAFNARGDRLAVGTHDRRWEPDDEAPGILKMSLADGCGELRVWNTSTWESDRVTRGRSGSVSAVVHSLRTGTWIWGNQKSEASFTTLRHLPGKIAAWDPAREEMRDSNWAMKKSVHQLHLSASGEWVTVLDTDGRAWLWRSEDLFKPRKRPDTTDR